ncbi:MAG: DUF4981 domain-containing protein [Bacteroidales bacterium]|nr:DUF4981 domain-containing protein [Bacteroidales bacterium]
MKLLAFLISIAAATAPGTADILPLHRDINTTSVNAQTRRTETVFFPDAESALSGHMEQSPFYESLNGEWDFLYFDSEKEVPADLASQKWEKIKVPGNWEVQGWGIPIYVNIPYEFAPVDPQPPVLPDDIPVGIYRRTFRVPESWNGREVYLNLCGVKSGVYTVLNGEEIAYSEDSKDLARIDITPYLREGENELVLKMTRWSTGSWLECQDFWRISGIERDVYLSSEAVRQDFDFALVSTLDEGLTDGLFRIDATPGTNFRLLDKDGSTVLEGAVPFEGKIPSVRKWSAENPELYALLLEKDGEFTHFNVGFRRTEIKGDIFYFNGQPIKFKGVNLHEHNEFTGHYTDREYIRASLLVMKRHNVNAIRTCHYPQSRAFYELCDSLGFYVYDEANIESHGMGYGEKSLAKHPEWFAKHIDRTLNMYMRTRNYPCVTLFSLGNEAGMGVNFLGTYKALKELEKGGQERPVVYERTAGMEGTDIHNPMYPKLTNLRYEIDDNPCNKPYVSCEYSHAMGNSNGSFDLMWELMYSHPRMQGGFIWDWVDQGLAVKDAAGCKYWTYGGDYGNIGTDPAKWFADRNFNCNGLVGPDLDPHPALVEVSHWYQNVSISARENPGEFTVLNRNYFTSLDAYDFGWELFCDGNIVSTGSLVFTTAPQSAEDFRIELPSMAMDHTWYINFTARNGWAQACLEKGFPLASDQVILVRADAPIAKQSAGKVRVKVSGDGRTATLKARRSKLVLDLAEGRVVSFRSRGRNLFDKSFGLRPNFWRAPTDNDWGNKYPVRAASWKEAPKVVGTDIEQLDNSATVTVEYALPDSCFMTVKYQLSHAGDLKLTTDFRGSGKDPIEVARIGFRTRMKASADKFRYFGRGPVENYQDRNSAAFLGLYEGSAKASLYPYVRPQESGHHTDCDWLRIGNALVLAGDRTFEFNALRASIEDLDPRNEDGSRIWAHVSDIPVRDYVELCIDGAMTGVGGYDSWGAKPEPYRTLFSNQNYHFEFTIGRK